MNDTGLHPIIIDTEPGVDDALAILFAHRASQLQVNVSRRFLETKTSRRLLVTLAL
jgi:hypothetical protein